MQRARHAQSGGLVALDPAADLLRKVLVEARVVGVLPAPLDLAQRIRLHHPRGRRDNNFFLLGHQYRMQIRTAALSGRASVPPWLAVPSEPMPGAPVILCVCAPADPMVVVMLAVEEAVLAPTLP